jgi:subtilisin
MASTSGGESINVAVLDTGVFAGHPDLARRVSQCKDFTQVKPGVADGKCEDKNGHGTHVAGIIAADSGADKVGLYGVAPAANIFAYKVCGNDGSCFADDVSAAIVMAADKGAKVINMSFGSDVDVPLIHDAVRYAASKDVLMVAAAGNDGLVNDESVSHIDYPAAYAEVIGVGAISQAGLVTDWSSRGTNETTTPWDMQDGDIEFAAPGEYIESTWNNGGYVFLSGTSMSAPFVTGLAAKYWQSTALAGEQSKATRADLRSLAKDLDPIGDDSASGYGLPQVQ